MLISQLFALYFKILDIIYMQWNAEILSATFSQFSWMHIKSQDGSINSESSIVPLLTKDPPHPLLLETPGLIFITSLVFPILEFHIMESQSIYFVCPASFSQHYLWNFHTVARVSSTLVLTSWGVFHFFIHSSAMDTGIFLDIVHKATVKILIQSIFVNIVFFPISWIHT